MKRQMINALHPDRNREIRAWIGNVIYIVLVATTLLYPTAWYLYIWIYRNMLFAEQSPIAGNAALSGQNLFVWIIGGIYSFILLIGMIAIFVRILDGEMNGIMRKVKAVVFLGSVQKNFSFHRVDAAQDLVRKLPTVGIVLESEKLEFNAALIVLDYLFAEIVLENLFPRDSRGSFWLSIDWSDSQDNDSSPSKS